VTRPSSIPTAARGEFVAANRIFGFGDLESMTTTSKAIEQLYVAFAKVPKPREIAGRRCFLDDKDIHTILATPLREIAPSDLSPYASSAFLTAGSAADYVYFLPRILEISATDDAWWPEIEVTGCAVRSCIPEAWPAMRTEALRGLLAAVIAEAIAAGDPDKLDSWMCAIGRMGFDVVPYLEQIARVPAAVLAYFEINVRLLPRERLSNAYWEHPSAAHDEIVRWFKSERIRKIPFDAYGYDAGPGS
jgi:hypothetical protein